MVIGLFKSEFERVASLVGAEFECLEISELQEYAQNHNFSTALINLVPIKRFTQSLGFNGIVTYKGAITLNFLTKAVISDNAETVKDDIIDQMIALSTSFYRTLHSNENLVFSNPVWDWGTNVERFKTANYLVGVTCEIGFETGCNRV